MPSLKKNPYDPKNFIGINCDQEVKDEDDEEFLYSKSKQCREYHKQWERFQRQNNTMRYQKQKEGNRQREVKRRAMGINRGRIWQINNRNRDRKYKREWAKRTGYNKKHYQKFGKIQRKIYKESGYRKVKIYLYRIKIKPPLNFTMTMCDRPWLKKGQWAWTFAHP